MIQPVLIGTGLVQQRVDDPSVASEPLRLMIDAARAAGQDNHVPGLLREVGRVYVPKGRWRYRDPGRAVALAIGAEHAESVLAKVGVLQEELIASACQAIAEGDIDSALVVGGDGGYRLLRARIAGVELVDSQQDSSPDNLWTASESLMTDLEIAALGNDAPPYYALLDSATRHAGGRSVKDHRDAVASLYAGFSRVAAENPHAWRRDPMLPELIRDSSSSNPMLAFPYTKLHTSDWSVDQASALLLCSAESADRHGVEPRRRVFPLASARSNSMVPVSERQLLHRSVGADLAARAAIDAAGVVVDGLDLVDLYSCFPVAVLHHALALGLRIDGETPPTITGGMRFAGGPFNNYVLHATAQLARALCGRRTPAVGMVSTVSGLLTKHAFSIWGTSTSTTFASIDVSDEVDRNRARRSVRRAHDGFGEVKAYTVRSTKEGRRAVALLDISTTERVLAWSDDDDVATAMTTDDFVGRRVRACGSELGL